MNTSTTLKTMPLNTPLYITTGEPAGIGPDITLMLLAELLLAEQNLSQNELSHNISLDLPYKLPLVVLGDIEMLKGRAKLLNLNINFKRYHNIEDLKQPALEQTQPTVPTIHVLHIPVNTPVVAGKLDSKNAQYVVEQLRQAAIACMEGTAAAVITAPVQKSVINEAGIPFSGHTEFFQEISNTHKVVMMLTANTLRVALATTHLPLSKVAAAITPTLLTEVIDILINDLVVKFGIKQPRILVCGLNPHAGESGYLGREELDIIDPVLAQYRAKGVNISSALPADTLFTPKYLDHADAVLAMYHDQGLPVLKYAGFGEAINITLGLPFIRTSVDHGTALDLAGTGKANTGSLKAAITLANQLASHKAV